MLVNTSTLCVYVAALSDCSGLWVRPAFSENETLKEMNQGTRETQMKQILNLNHSQCEPNQIRARQKQSHAPTDTRTNHSSSADSGLGRGVASGLWYGSDSDKAPPIRDEAVHSRTRVSSLNDDRQSELQYYVSKVQQTHTHTHVAQHTHSHSFLSVTSAAGAFPWRPCGRANQRAQT